MGHTCDNCGETFETLTRRRLHDCPGVNLDDNDQTQALADELAAGLDRGDTVSGLPDGGLPYDEVDTLREYDAFLTVISPMNNPEEPTSERLAILVSEYGYVVEYFPWGGWIVTRATHTGGMSEEEAMNALREQIQDWQSRVTEFALDYAGGEDDVSERLREELDL